MTSEEIKEYLKNHVCVPFSYKEHELMMQKEREVKNEQVQGWRSR